MTCWRLGEYYMNTYIILRNGDTEENKTFPNIYMLGKERREGDIMEEVEGRRYGRNSLIYQHIYFNVPKYSVTISRNMFKSLNTANVFKSVKPHPP